MKHYKSMVNLKDFPFNSALWPWDLPPHRFFWKIICQLGSLFLFKRVLYKVGFWKHINNSCVFSGILSWTNHEPMRCQKMRNLSLKRNFQFFPGCSFVLQIKLNSTQNPRIYIEKPIAIPIKNHRNPRFYVCFLGVKLQKFVVSPPPFGIPGNWVNPPVIVVVHESLWRADWKTPRLGGLPLKGWVAGGWWLVMFDLVWWSWCFVKKNGVSLVWFPMGCVCL